MGQRFVHHGFVHHGGGVSPAPCCVRAFPHSHVFVAQPFVSPFVVSPFVATRPAPAFVFVPGFWSWNGFNWIWVRGHWQ